MYPPPSIGCVGNTPGLARVDAQISNPNTRMSATPAPPLNFRPLADKDIELVRHWLCQEHIRPWYDAPEEWLREIRGREGEFFFIHHLIVCEKGRSIGFCQYYRCQESGEPEYRTFWRMKSHSIDYLIGERDYLGRGLGKALVSSLVHLVFSQTDAGVIVVQPERDNDASRATLIACGFERDVEHDLFVRWRRDVSWASL